MDRVASILFVYTIPPKRIVCLDRYTAVLVYKHAWWFLPAAFLSIPPLAAQFVRHPRHTPAALLSVSLRLLFCRPFTLYLRSFRALKGSLGMVLHSAVILEVDKR